MQARMKHINMACAVLLSACASTQPNQQDAGAISPSISVDGQSNTVTSFYQLARYYQGQNRFDMAINSYRKVLKADPGYVEAHNGLGVIYSRQGHFEDAVAEFKSALSLSPQAAHLYSNLGYTYFLQQKYDQALDAINQAIALDPRNQYAKHNLELIYEKTGKVDEVAQTSSPSVDHVTKDEIMPDKLVESSSDGWEIKALNQEASGKIVKTKSTDVKLIQLAPAVFELTQPNNIETSNPDNPVKPSTVSNPKVEVANGNGVTGLARKLGGFLVHAGYRSARLTNQKPFNVQSSQIQFREGYLEAAKKLQSSLPIAPELVPKQDLRTDIQIRLLIGKDMTAFKQYF